MTWTFGSLLKRGREPIKAHKLLLTSTCSVLFPFPQRSKIAPWNVGFCCQSCSGVSSLRLSYTGDGYSLSSVMVPSCQNALQVQLCHAPTSSAHGHQGSASSSLVQMIKPGFYGWRQRVICSTSSARHEFCLLRSIGLIFFTVTKRFVHNLFSICSSHPLYYKMSQCFSASFWNNIKTGCKGKFLLMKADLKISEGVYFCGA